MGEAMGRATQAAFVDAIRQALLAATVIAIVTATVVSLAVAARIARPVTALAHAARRVADGRYEERVRTDEPGVLGDLAESFNDMAASLEATERRRLQLVGDVAHELRTPLTTIDGYLEGLEDGVIEPTAATWALLRTETGRLTRLVSDLSELWRAEAHQLQLGLDSVDVAAVATEVAEGFGPQAATRNVRLDLQTERAVAVADRDRVAQILGNYVSNALRHAPDGSTVTVANRDCGVARAGLRLRRGAGPRAGPAGGRLRALLPGRPSAEPGRRRCRDRPRDRPRPRRRDGGARVGRERRSGHRARPSTWSCPPPERRPVRTS